MTALRYTLVALVENHSGVLARVASLFSRRGLNVESLAVAPAEAAGLARMTIVLEGALEQREQVVRQLDKLVDVLAVHALADDGTVACATGGPGDPRPPAPPKSRTEVQ